MPANPSKGDPFQFDYDTISDVIFHIRYTAREGGDLLRRGAIDNLKAAIDTAQAVSSVRLFSVRHEFPTAWAKLQSQTPAADQRIELTLNLRDEHYPFWSKGRLNTIKRIDLMARSTANPVPGSLDIFQSVNANDNNKKGTLAKDVTRGQLLIGQLTDVKLLQPNGGLLAKPTGELQLFFDNKARSDLWLAVTWSGI